jgi:hypothetical protein
LAEPGSEQLCLLCAERAPAPRRALCGRCRAEQFRLLCAEAIGGGFFFVSLAALLYLLGRWYAG